MADDQALAVREVSSPELIRAELARSRARLELATAGLKDDLHLFAAWRAWAKRHPWLSIAAGLAVGVAAGALVGRLSNGRQHGHQRDDAD